MSNDPLHRKTLDRIYREVIEHLKSSGAFDDMRVNLMDPIWSDPEFKYVIETFQSECKEFCHNIDLNRPRKDLRLSLDRHFENMTASTRKLKDCISTILKDRELELKEKFMNLVKDYLHKRFTSPQVETDKEMDIDMDIDLGESPTAPEFSPISVDGADTRQSDPKTPNEIPVPPEPSPKEQEPTLEDIPIPPEDPEEDRKVELSTPLQDEIPSQPLSDELERLTFSSVSSVHTADLSDFEDSIKLSDDEANIVGQPKNSRIKIEELQGTINGLRSTSQPVSTPIYCKQECTATTQTTVENAKHESVDQQSQEPSETGESDACSESTTNSSRRAARKRKSNPRYSNEHFTS